MLMGACLDVFQSACTISVCVCVCVCVCVYFLVQRASLCCDLI